MNKTALTALILALAVWLGGCTGTGAPPASQAPSETPVPMEPQTPEPVPTPEPTPEPSAGLDFSALPAPEDREIAETLPDLFATLAGAPVVSAEDYDARTRELRDLYQYYMYGFYPDGSAETTTYGRDGKALTVTVEFEGRSVSFDALISVPDPAKVPVPEGGYPVIVVLGFVFGDALEHGIPYQYALDNGYAVITYNAMQLAADSGEDGLVHTGLFYDLHPYTDDVFTQAGALLAWAWGGSKVIDALENGLGAECALSAENIILTGVSRFGKSASVAGAFDERIRVTAPACSGTGGMALFRYNSQGHVYDFSPAGGRAEYRMGQNEALRQLVGNGAYHWFNDVFRNFPREDGAFRLPFDQHMLAALCGTGGRHLFIITAYSGEDWTNPPGMYGTFLAAQKAFDFTGTPDHLSINIHPEGHAVVPDDLEKLIAYCNYHFYGLESPIDLSVLKTSLFDEVEGNRYADLDALVGR